MRRVNLYKEVYMQEDRRKQLLCHVGNNSKSPLMLLGFLHCGKVFKLAIFVIKEHYRFVLELPVDCTLDELAGSNLEMADFDGDHFSDFYIASTLYGKKTFLTDDGEWQHDNDDVLDRELKSIFPLAKNKKLFYYYDCWRFLITKKGKAKPATVGQEYPRIILEEGIKPLEYGPDEEEDEDEE